MAERLLFIGLLVVGGANAAVLFNSSDGEMLRDGVGVVGGAAYFRIASARPVERYVLLQKTYNMSSLLGVGPEQNLLGNHVRAYCERVHHERDALEKVAAAQVDQPLFIPVSPRGVTLAMAKQLCAEEGGELPSIMSNWERDRIIHFMEEHRLVRIHFSQEYDVNLRRHVDIETGEDLGYRFWGMRMVKCSGSEPAHTILNEQKQEIDVGLNKCTGEFEVDKHVANMNEGDAFLLRVDRTIENYQAEDGKNHGQVIVPVCRRSNATLEVIGGVRRSQLNYLRNRCGEVTQGIYDRGGRYQSQVMGMLKNFQMVDSSVDDWQLAKHIELPRIKLTRRARFIVPEAWIQWKEVKHRDRRSEAAWQTASAVVETVSTFFPFVGGIYRAFESYQVHGKQIEQDKRLDALEKGIDQWAIRSGELEAGQNELWAQVGATRATEQELQKLVREVRLEALTVDMLSAADGNSRQLDAAARDALRRFEEILTSLSGGTTPVAMLSFRELSDLEDVLQSDERLHRDHKQMVSVVLPMKKDGTIPIVTKIAVTSRQEVNLYQAVAIPHMTATGDMVKVSLPHSFFALTEAGFQSMPEYQVVNCMHRVCVLNRPDFLETGTPCGVFVAQQADELACPVVPAPRIDYFEVSFDRRFLIYSAIDSATVSLYCQDKVREPLRSVHLKGAGAMAIPPGCYYSEPKSGQKFMGPVPISDQVYTIADLTNMGLNVDLPLPQYVEGVPYEANSQTIPHILSQIQKTERETQQGINWIWVVVIVIGTALLCVGCTTLGAYMHVRRYALRVKQLLRPQVHELAARLEKLRVAATTAVGLPSAPHHTEREEINQGPRSILKNGLSAGEAMDCARHDMSSFARNGIGRQSGASSSAASFPVHAEAARTDPLQSLALRIGNENEYVTVLSRQPEARVAFDDRRPWGEDDHGQA
jgi:hypothetical protein